MCPSRATGTPVTGLTARDFRLTDRGVLQTITDVSREQFPVDVTFVADLVGSVEGPWLNGFRRAFETMRRSLRDDDRGRLVLFDPRIKEINGIEYARVNIQPQKLAVRRRRELADRRPGCFARPRRQPGLPADGHRDDRGTGRRKFSR